MAHRSTTRTLQRALGALVLLALLGIPLVDRAPLVRAATAGPGDAGFNYAEALQKSILFYEAQRSGRLSTASIPTRLSWRGDSQLTDGLAQGVDLTGGWVDAGDNVKYGFPMASSLTMLAWGAVEYRQAFADSGQLPWMLNQLRWANDYLIKAHPAPNTLWVQVGMTTSDHSMWAPIESTQHNTDRRAIKIDAACPGSDAAGETAAAMAASSIVFRPTDAAYADTLLAHAEQLYSFADTYRGKYSDCVKLSDPQLPYPTYGDYTDELVWGGGWLYLAKEARQPGSGAAYLAKAESGYGSLGLELNTPYRRYKWTQNWDDKSFGAYVLMAKLRPDNITYQADAERFLDYWTVGVGGQRVPYTPGGHARLDQWGSLRYAANTAFVAFVYGDWLGDAAKRARYHSFAEQQINYILGQNPRNASYIGGFGENPPQRPHHRTAHGSWAQQQSVPANHRHILYGALAGSPSTDDSFNDRVDDYVANEVALDYNAGLTGALAKMYALYGGTPLPHSSFPLPDRAYSCQDEWGAFAIAYSNSAGGVGPSVYLENRTGWPARASSQLKFRYFFTLDAADPSDVTVSVGGAPSGATVSGPTLWNAAQKIYYVTFDLAGTTIYPGYAYGPAGPEVRFTLGSRSNSWNSANDWSFQGWSSTYKGGYGSHAYAANIPIYEGPDSSRLCGSEPPADGAATPTSTGTPTPVTPTSTRTPTVTVPCGAVPTLPSQPTMRPCGTTRTPTGTPTGTPAMPSSTPTRTLTPSSTAYAVSAEFQGTPLEGPAPLAVTFSGGIPPGYCSWNYGDGTTQGINGCLTHTHVYTRPGIYTVSLGVTRQSGASASKTRPDYIRVYEATPTATAAPSATPTPSPTAVNPCQVTYRVSNQWSTGFTTDITIKNNGTVATKSWVLTLTWPGNQQITNIWNATATQTGRTVIIRSNSWNGVLPPGGSTSIGFQASYSGTNSPPSITCDFGY